MQVTMKFGPLTATLEAETQQALFEEIASFQEVFNMKHTIQGKDIEPEDIRFLVRQNDDEDKFYELVYRGPDRDLWGYKFQFGCNKKGGGLFPRRKLDTKTSTHEDELPKYDWEPSGWRRWKKENGKVDKQVKASKPKAKSEDDGEAPF